MAEDSAYKVEDIARERLLWVIKPIGAVSLVVWCFHPSTSTKAMTDSNSLLGFLLGAVLAIFIYREQLEYFLVSRRKTDRDSRNRVPEEFYFGEIKQRLFKKD